MKIFFSTSKLAKALNEEVRMVREYGTTLAKIIRHRLAVLQAAESLSDVPRSPPERCHKLHGPYGGCFAVDLGQPFRMVFKPTDEALHKPGRKPLSLRRVTEITIVEIVDYH